MFLHNSSIRKGIDDKRIGTGIFCLTHKNRSRFLVLSCNICENQKPSL